MRPAADAAVEPPEERSARRFVIAGLLFAALALRPQLNGVGPLLPAIRDQFGLSHAAAGALTTIPVLCMALFALPAARLFGAFGARRSVALALLLIVGGGALRAVSPEVISLLALTAVFGIGAGLAGTLFPAVVKESAPRAPAFATSVYSMGINGGAGLAAAVAVPLAELTGTWRGSLGIFAVAGALSLAAWLGLNRGNHPRLTPVGPSMASRAGLPWKRLDAWTLAVVFGLQGVCFYGLNAWLAAFYIERGWEAAAAGWLVAVLNLITLPATLLVAVLGDRVPRRVYLLAAAILLCVAIGGMGFAPSGAWWWTGAAGIACGSLFPLAMTLTVEIAHSPREASGVAGLMLGVGYLFAALAPVALGAVRDITGDFETGLRLLAGLAAILVVVCLVSVRFGGTRSGAPAP